MSTNESAISPSGDARRILSRRKVLAAGGAAAALGAAGAGLHLSRTPVGLVRGVSRARPVQGDLVLPAAVEVVIIGGGFVGTMAALTLAERGVSVALCEKGVIAGEASGRSMGYVDSQLLDPIKLELVTRSKLLWSQINTRIGIDTGYRPTGLVASLPGEEELTGAEGWLGAIRGIPGMEARIISGTELMRVFPGMSDPPRAALYTPTDASVEPRLAAPAIAEAARRKGAVILQGCAVRGLELRAGRVAGVVTEKGPIACQAVVLAGGAWSSLFAKSLGWSVPQLNVYLSMMGLGGAAGGPAVPLSGEGYGFRPQTDGNYSLGVVDFAVPIEPATIANFRRLLPAIKAFWPMAHMGFSPSQFWSELRTPSRWALDRPSPFEAYRILVPPFRAGPLNAALTELRRHFPTFEQAYVLERWAGVISSTPDNMPVISSVAKYPGLYVGSAFTYGLTMGLAAGEALADLATGRVPPIDLRPYRLERFSDGSPMAFRS